MSDFHLQGAVPIASEAYIERDFEARILENLLAARWVLFLGPRQHGKSTAILRIRGKLSDGGIKCAIIDLQEQPQFSSFEDLLRWFGQRVAKQFDTNIADEPDEADRGQLKSWLTLAIGDASTRVVIIIDEAALITNDEWRNLFYAQIRSMAGLPPEDPCAKICFLFAGCFRPETLVNTANSPFNVCQRVDTEDFSFEQAVALNANVTGEVDKASVGLAFNAVGGQPYLLQVILSQIRGVAASDRAQRVSNAIDRLRFGEDDHFQGVFTKVVSEPELTKIIARLARDGAIPNEPANPDYKYLSVLGIVKRDGFNLVFRNPLYAEFARQSSQIVEQADAAPSAGPLIVPSTTAYAFMKSPELREIAFTMELGAVRSHNAGSYRLALAGFGSALEAVLIDWLKSLSVPVLATAVAAAKGKKVGAASFNKNYEVETDPGTFRLVNLVKVARSVPNAPAMADPPESLREWRNLIHPGNAINNYLPESDLEPESRTASGLLSMARREIGAII